MIDFRRPLPEGGRRCPPPHPVRRRISTSTPKPCAPGTGPSATAGSGPTAARQYRRTAGEFGYYDDDPYADPEFTREPLHDRVEAVVVGGGFGGLLAAARLRQAGVEDIRVIEKGGDFGGTWYWNRYPGIHCDIESYIYLPLLEEVGYVPKWRYAPGEEIRQHAAAIGRHFDLYDDACFQTQVDRTPLGRDRVGVDRRAPTAATG